MFVITDGIEYPLDRGVDVNLHVDDAHASVGLSSADFRCRPLEQRRQQPVEQINAQGCHQGPR